MSEEKGFFGSLFDFSFTSFVFPKVIKVVFAILVVFAAIAAIAVLVMAFNNSTTTGIAALVLSPFIFCLYVLLFRIWMEVAIVLFRILDNVQKIADKP